MVLSAPQRRLLRGTLAGRLTAACFGAGVDSTAMLVALKLADLRPDIITFADLRAEKPETLDHLHRMNAVLVEWGWEPIAVCRKETLPGTGYSDLYGNCMSNETLPSLAFGLKSCSAKWKRIPQDQLIMGVKSGPNARPPHPIWIEAGRRGWRSPTSFATAATRSTLVLPRKRPQPDASRKGAPSPQSPQSARPGRIAGTREFLIIGTPYVAAGETVRISAWRMLPSDGRTVSRTSDTARPSPRPAGRARIPATLAGALGGKDLPRGRLRGVGHATACASQRRMMRRRYGPGASATEIAR